MTQHQRYKNPPIEEALCEFCFNSSQDWDFTIPGKLHSKLEDDYSGKSRNQKAMNVKIQAGDLPNLKCNEELARVQLVSRDGKRIVGVGPNTLSVHMLRPYQSSDSKNSGWADFKSRITKALNTYWDVTESDGICRVGIRYINKIIIPAEETDIKEYLQVTLPNVNGLSKKLTSFTNQVRYDYQDEVRLILSQGYTAAVSQAHHRELLLDLDVIWSPPEPVLQDEALRMVDDLRTREREAFEAIITDKTRELFNV